MTPAGLALIGVPANSSGTVDGVARAPAVLRQRGLATALARHPGFTDAGDLALPVPVPVRGPSGLLAEDALVAMIEHVAQAVGAARRRGRFPLLLGGDCPLILGALAALQTEPGRAGLLFVDGHEDAWPPPMSPTGEAADCELGLALRLFDTGLSSQLRAALPRIDPADVAAVGPRDAAELLTADRYAAALASLPPPWWLHTDLDVLTTAELAAVDYPQPGGLTWDQLAGLTATALAADGCAGWSVCIYNPDLDPGRDGADAIVSYITQAITATSQPAR